MCIFDHDNKIIQDAPDLVFTTALSSNIHSNSRSDTEILMVTICLIVLIKWNEWLIRNEINDSDESFALILTCKISYDFSD